MIFPSRGPSGIRLVMIFTPCNFASCFLMSFSLTRFMQDDGASDAEMHGRLRFRRGGRYAASHGQRGACAQRLPQHVQEIVKGCDDAWDVSQEAFCTSTYKCNLVATDIFPSAGAGAPPGPLLVPLSQKSSSARGPGPRRVERSRPRSPPP